MHRAETDRAPQPDDAATPPPAPVDRQAASPVQQQAAAAAEPAAAAAATDVGGNGTAPHAGQTADLRDEEATEGELEDQAGGACKQS